MTLSKAAVFINWDIHREPNPSPDFQNRQSPAQFPQSPFPSQHNDAFYTLPTSSAAINSSKLFTNSLLSGVPLQASPLRLKHLNS